MQCNAIQHDELFLTPFNALKMLQARLKERSSYGQIAVTLCLLQINYEIKNIWSLLGERARCLSELTRNEFNLKLLRIFNLLFVSLNCTISFDFEVKY